MSNAGVIAPMATSVALDIGVVAFLVFVATVVVGSCVLAVREGLGVMDVVRRQRLAHGRAGRARRALLEASLEADYFEPEEIELRVRQLLGTASRIWSGDRSYDPHGSVITRWARSVVDLEGPGARIHGRPVVDVLGVVNRAGQSEDRVILRVRFRAHQPPGENGEVHTWTADMRWTLGRAHSRWVLLSIDGDPLADGALKSRLIPARWADDRRLTEESLLELADDDKVAAGTDFGSLVASDLPADRQLGELAQLDGRFDPTLLGAVIEHLLEAWEEACTGSTAPLAAVASGDAARKLLHPVRGEHHRDRFILHDAVLRRSQPLSLDLTGGGDVPSVRFRVIVTAVAYLLGDDREGGTRVVGDRQARTDLWLTWTLALSTRGSGGWQLIDTSDPARGVVGS